MGQHSMAEPSQLKSNGSSNVKWGPELQNDLLPLGSSRKLRLEDPTNNSEICYWS